MSAVASSPKPNDGALSWPWRAARFLGRGAAAWLAAGALGAAILGFVELAIAVFLQLFLHSLGILSRDLLALGPLGGLTLSPGAVLLGLLAVGFVRACGQFIVLQSAGESMERINARLRRLVTYDLLFDPRRSLPSAAMVNAHLSETFPKASQFCYHATTLISQALQIILVALWMVSSAPVETLAGLIGLGAVGFLVLRIAVRVRAIGARIPAEQVALSEGVERVARNALLVRVLRTQDREYGVFSRAIANFTRHSTRAWLLTNLANAMTPFLGLVLLVGLIYLSRSMGKTPSLALVSFLYLFVRLVQSLAVSATTWSTLNLFRSQFTSALRYFESFPAARRAEALSGGRPPRHDALTGGAPAAPSLVLEDIHFTYPGRNDELFAGLSLSVEAGTQLAIVGPSGCGKSTLLSLLLGVLDPSAGSVRIAGEDARTFFEHGTSRVGYVGAEPFLLAGTIRENLSYGLGAPRDDEACWKALERASLRPVIEKLPGGLAHVLPEDGSGLSAGQKQRLCLARALLGDPCVLVLDEVSANLDETTEEEIAESLRVLRGSCTTVIVSHRKGILRWADRSVDLGKPQLGLEP